MTAPIVSLQDLGDYLGLDLSDSERAVIAIDSASEIVRSYLGQSLDYVEEDEQRMDGTGTHALVLPQLPIRLIRGVTLLDRDDVAITDPVLQEGTDWYIDMDAGILFRRSAVWPLGTGNMLVRYDHGYEADPEDEDFIRYPSDIREVALSLAKRIYNAGGSGSALTSETGGSITSETIGSYHYTASSTGGSTEVTQAAAAPSTLLPGEIAVLEKHVVRRYR